LGKTEKFRALESDRIEWKRTLLKRVDGYGVTHQGGSRLKPIIRAAEVQTSARPGVRNKVLW
jgi:hypothetical protein